MTIAESPSLPVRFALLVCVALLAGCASLVKQKDVNRPVLLKSESASMAELRREVDRYAGFDSIRAKMDLKFEDNSFADIGVAEKYRTADADIIIKRPGKIFLKIQAPLAIASIDIAQMTSDGETFRVAILEDGGSGKNRKFILGTNSADYSALQQEAESLGPEVDKELLKKVSAFSNIRPQHFTEAVMMRPTDDSRYSYSRSSVFAEEDDLARSGKGVLRKVLRNYYLLDEYLVSQGSLSIVRRFWFDRVGGIRLARQQVFDASGEVESDIVYGKEGRLTGGDGFDRLPLQIEITRPKDKYKIRVSYQTPELVMIGLGLRDEIFILQNDKNLPVVDLDERLRNVRQTKQ
jgi:hypothetical protein